MYVNVTSSFPRTPSGSWMPFLLIPTALLLLLLQQWSHCCWPHHQKMPWGQGIYFLSACSQCISQHLVFSKLSIVTIILLQITPKLNGLIHYHLLLFTECFFGSQVHSLLNLQRVVYQAGSAIPWLFSSIFRVSQVRVFSMHISQPSSKLGQALTHDWAEMQKQASSVVQKTSENAQVLLKPLLISHVLLSVDRSKSYGHAKSQCERAPSKGKGTAG